MSLSNPKHVEYEVVRTSLLPGALKTAQFNRAMPVSVRRNTRVDALGAPEKSYRRVVCNVRRAPERTGVHINTCCS